MARMLPNWILSDAPPGEKRVFVGLRDDQVTKDWIVLHSLTLSRHVRQEKGEIDFVVIAPGFGVLVVEVKSHRNIVRENGTWRLGNDSPTTRSPFEQAELNRYSLTNQLKRAGRRVPPMRSVVAFTNVNFSENSLEWLPWQCIDKSQINLQGVGGAIKSAFIAMQNHLKLTRQPDQLAFDAEDAEKLATFLRGDFEVSESLAATTQNRFEEYHNFLEEQFEALDQLDEHPILLFEGAAGTGKTLLALETARRALESGKRIIMLCRNRYLSSFLRNSLGEHENLVFCGTYHSLMLRMTDSHFDSPEEAWFDTELPRRAIEFLEGPQSIFAFDVLIVDEIQDFSNENVLNFLSLLPIACGATELRFFGDFAHQLLFYQDQNARDQFRTNFPGVETFQLWTNCRNREGVGDLICSIRNRRDIYRRFRLKGRDNCTQFHYYNSMEEKIGSLARALHEATKSFPLGEVVVLGLRSEFDPRQLSQSLRDKFYFSEPDDMANRRKIFSSSARKFKGLESQLVIIHDFEIGGEEDIVYAGVSRAIEKLVLVAHRSDQVDILERLASSI